MYSLITNFYLLEEKGQIYGIKGLRIRRTEKSRRQWRKDRSHVHIHRSMSIRGTVCFQQRLAQMISTCVAVIVVLARLFKVSTKFPSRIC